MQYYFDRNINDGLYTKESSNIFKISVGPGDYINSKEKYRRKSLIDTKPILEYAEKNPDKNNLEIFQHFGFPVPVGSQINNERLCPPMFYKKDEKGNIIPKKNIICRKNKYKQLEESQSLSFLLEESQVTNYSKLPKIQYNSNNKKRTPIKKNIKKLINTSKIVIENEITKEQKEIKQFELCMNYFYRLFGQSNPYEIPFESIQSLGQIYYLLKYPIYNIFKNNGKKSKEIEIVNINNLSSDKQYIKKLFNINQISEKIFIKSNNVFSETQLAEEFNNKVNIYSDTDIIMDSIINENNKNENVDINKIIVINQIDSSLINKYHLIFLLKAKKVHVMGDDYDMQNLVYQTNIKKSSENINDVLRKYYFSFYLGNQPLAPVELRNKEKLSKIGDSEFYKLMDNIKYGEPIIIAFDYCPIYYFNINRGTFNLKTNAYHMVFFIDCSKKNSQLSNIYEHNQIL